MSDGGPECAACGLTTCPDTNLPEFTEPVECALTAIYNGLRYDRCEYGCGRDITLASIRRDIAPTVERIKADAVAGERARWVAGVGALARAFAIGIPEGPAAIHFCPEGCLDIWESEGSCCHEPGYRGAARDLLALVTNLTGGER